MAPQGCSLATPSTPKPISCLQLCDQTTSIRSRIELYILSSQGCKYLTEPCELLSQPTWALLVVMPRAHICSSVPLRSPLHASREALSLEWDICVKHGAGHSSGPGGCYLSIILGASRHTVAGCLPDSVGFSPGSSNDHLLP